MLKQISGATVRVAERWMPDPLVVAIFLTLVVFAAAVSLTPFTIVDTVDAWGNGFWSLLTFTGQIMLILGLGHVLAHTAPVATFLIFLTNFLRSARMAYMGLFIIGALASLVSWGLGLIAPAILSRIVARNLKERGIRVHFPLLVFCGITGSTMWVFGLTSSIPLAVNNPGHFLEDKMGLLPTSETIGSSWSIGLVILLMLVLPAIYASLAPDDKDLEEMASDVKLDPATEVPKEVPVTPAQKIENSRAVMLVLATIAGSYVIKHFAVDGEGLNLDIMNLSFLTLCLAFSGSTRHFLDLLANAARVISPFFIQYPMYAGLMGLMADSGLGAMIVELFVSFSTAETLPLWTFYSAGLVNLFVPSGGGQWAVQGPIVIEAARQLGTDFEHVTMAVALGDTWTNTIQPLYLIPALAITGVRLGQVIGYGVIAFFALGISFSVALMLY
jgi:short-chain fatty acids transporter